MDLCGSIKTKKIEIRDSREPLAIKRKMEKSKDVLVEYDINESDLYFGILPPE